MIFVCFGADFKQIFCKAILRSILSFYLFFKIFNQFRIDELRTFGKQFRKKIKKLDAFLEFVLFHKIDNFKNRIIDLFFIIVVFVDLQDIFLVVLCLINKLNQRLYCLRLDLFLDEYFVKYKPQNLVGASLSFLRKHFFWNQRIMVGIILFKHVKIMIDVVSIYIVNFNYFTFELRGNLTNVIRWC